MDVFIGTILPWPINYAPAGWAFCDGSVLQVNQYAALYSLLGNTYGGTPNSTFALPDLRCRIPLGMANSNPPAGLTRHNLGTQGGLETVALTVANLAAHTHVATFTSGSAGGTLQASPAPANTASPAGNYLANSSDPTGATGPFQGYVTPAAKGAVANVAGLTITGTGTVTNANTGSSTPAAIMPPFLVLNFIIALEGLYPPRQ